MFRNTPILCIDDDPDSAELMLLWLKTNGYDTISVSSCEEALELLETQQFELCIVDYRMPNSTGVELCQKVRQKCPGLPFILNTGDVRQQVQMEAARAGIHFLPKPTFLELLLRVVKSIVHCSPEKL